MVRPTQLLHPPRSLAAVRPAATVLLLRDSTDPARPGIEVLMTRRSMTASFAPGAYVFPGGGIDAADAQAHSLSSRRSTQGDLHLTQAIAAIRESFEEAEAGVRLCMAVMRSGTASCRRISANLPAAIMLISGSGSFRISSHCRKRNSSLVGMDNLISLFPLLITH